MDHGNDNDASYSTSIIPGVNMIGSYLGLALLLVSRTTAFTAQSSPRYNTNAHTDGTKLHQYGPTKWTPEHGSSVASFLPNQKSAPADLGVQTEKTASIERTDYSGVKWSPQGSHQSSSPSFSSPVSATSSKTKGGVADASVNSASKDTGSIAATRDFSGIRWSPQGGSSAYPRTPAVRVEKLAHILPQSAADASAAAPAVEGLDEEYTGVRWTILGGSLPANTNEEDTALANLEAKRATGVNAAATAPLQSAGEGNDTFSGVKWSPQGGSNPSWPETVIFREEKGLSPNDFASMWMESNADTDKDPPFPVMAEPDVNTGPTIEELEEEYRKLYNKDPE